MIHTPDSVHHSYSWSDETGAGAGKRSKMYHSTPTPPTTTNSLSTWDIDGGLAADFDGSLSGLGTELGTASYNMSEALLALPVFKQENLENGFQYILGAATSPAVKMNEETLTYLNQGQSYEIKLKKLGDLSELQGKYLRSIVKVLFHDRRLQFMEKEQIDSWKQMRPGERILDIDIPLSYGLVNVNLDPVRLNQLEFIWDPTKETGLYVRVHCISTEFTAKKHGGEKGVPFRIQVETYTNTDEAKLLHAASCQIKVFKPKGADRKHKTDREKMEKRSEVEKEKYQPSYECTVLTEVPKDQILQANTSYNKTQSLTSSFAELNCTASPNPSISPPQSTTPHTPLPFSHTQTHEPVDVLSGPLSSDAQAADVAQWLHYHRFSNYVRVFQNFSGADLLRLSRDDLIQICGLADGIRLDNALQARNIRPRLTIYICQEPESIYHALYMDTLVLEEFKVKLSSLFGIQTQQIGDIYMQGPSQIHILLTDDVIQNTQDQARFVVEGMKDESGDKYRILLKTVGDR
ncbi:transcription factor CP2-like isoform X2 [Physella acuta]|uniref:transcription factor CP2-like isoform X2 n=1 Tax=Physella acuta TaxID=109671 RepID=UPI0027DD1D72|nr:transcription factor CP2-like isoform X2 [Physella acuta]